MAQKATKTLAARNTQRLNKTHLISFGLHTLLFLTYLIFSRPSSLKRILLFTTPALALEIYLELLGRPKYNSDVSRTVRTPGADLAAEGLTEFMWDVVYWTWGCIGLAIVLGDRGWWAYIAVPVYAVYAAYAAVMGVKKGFAGLAGGAGGVEGDGMGAGAGESKRAKKMEKRGGQRMQYR